MESLQQYFADEALEAEEEEEDVTDRLPDFEMSSDDEDDDDDKGEKKRYSLQFLYACTFSGKQKLI